jgi:hypothetical protein
MSDYKPLILWVDPGLASGICLVERDGPTVVWSSEEDWKGTVRLATDALRSYGGDKVHVGCERFIITPKTGTNSQAPWSLEIIGMMRLLSEAYGAGELDLQNPNEALEFVPNDRLKAFGLWHKGGKGHAKDALRHALLHLVNTTHGQDRRLLG